MISIVTITYNNFQELEKTIQSVLASNHSNFELIVVNGGTCSLGRNYLNKLPEEVAKQKSPFPVKVLQEPDQGIADAFNKGIGMAEGEWIIFLNSGDTLIDPDYLYWAESFLKENGRFKFVHSDIIFEDALCGDMRMGPRLCSLGRGMPYYHQTMILDRTVFKELGSFKLRYKMAMDFELVCRMRKSGVLGHYYTHRPTVRMDGKGVSVLREGESIKECKQALKENGLFQGKNKWEFFVRLLFFKIRLFLLRIRMTRFLVFLKKIKNSIPA